jgi:metal-dependent hydrolase (beta-lactamase superfamily II)
VIGGTHLISADDQYLDHIIDVFQDRYPDCNFYLNHCTGKNVLERLTEKLGDRIQMFPAGSAVEFPE